jgi:hypothetical protein
MLTRATKTHEVGAADAIATVTMMKQLATTLLAVTAGCAAAEQTDGAFNIEGRLVDAANVTHVVAANPVNGKRVVSRMQADGRFELALEPGAQWVVTFADWTKVGKDMQVATLQADGIDAFVAQGPASLDFGTIKVKAGRAHGTVEYGELLLALGVDKETATRMGRTDNLALRYANPDIDNDGTIDGLQHGHDFRLDITGAYTLTTSGRPATITDLVAGTWDKAALSYTSTTIQAAVPRSMGMNMASGTVMFDKPFYGTALGDATPMVAPHTEIGAPHVKTGELDGNKMIGVVAHGAQNAPTGTYELGFDLGQLTFSDVFTPNAASLIAGTDYEIPFVHIRPTVAGCKSDCDIAGIDLEWRRMTSDGWQPAVGPKAARIDMGITLNGKPTYLGATLDAATTSLAWSEMPVWNTGILQSELAYVQTSEICSFKVSYASELGMKMTMSVANPACF